MARTIVAAALFVAVLDGCAGGLGENAIGVTHHITPLPRNYKDIVTDYLKTRLNDRAIVKVGNAYQDSCRRSVNGIYHGWVVPVSYRAMRGARATSQEIIWVNENSVQMISNNEAGHCSKA